MATNSEANVLSSLRVCGSSSAFNGFDGDRPGGTIVTHRPKSNGTSNANQWQNARRMGSPEICRRKGNTRTGSFLFVAFADPDGHRHSLRQVLDETAQVVAAGVVLQLAQSFRFDLADALARDLEDSPRLFERITIAVSQAVTQLDDLALAIREALENVVDLVFEQLVHRRFRRRVLGAVFEEVAERAVFALSHGRVEADGVLPGLHDALRFFEREPDGAGQLFHCRLAPLFLPQLFAFGFERRNALEHMHRNANRAGMIGDGARDGLANPPRGIRRKLVAAPIFVLFDPAHEPGVPFLDQVEKAEAPVAVLLGDRDDQPQVAPRELLLGLGPDSEPRLDRADAGPQAFWSFLGHERQIVQLALAAVQLVDVAARTAQIADQLFELIHPAADLVEPFHDRLQPLRDRKSTRLNS